VQTNKEQLLRCPGCGKARAVREFECFYFYQVGIICTDCKLCVKATGYSLGEAAEELEWNIKIKEVKTRRGVSLQKPKGVKV